MVLISSFPFLHWFNLLRKTQVAGIYLRLGVSNYIRWVIKTFWCKYNRLKHNDHNARARQTADLKKPISFQFVNFFANASMVIINWIDYLNQNVKPSRSFERKKIMVWVCAEYKQIKRSLSRGDHFFVSCFDTVSPFQRISLLFRYINRATALGVFRSFRLDWMEWQYKRATFKQINKQWIVPLIKKMKIDAFTMWCYVWSCYL